VSAPAAGDWSKPFRLGAAALIIGGYAQVSPVGHSESAGSDQTVECSLAQYEDVVDDLIRWADVSVAVVPGELYELEKIECGGHRIGTE
jgi:hypothetical protein